MRSFFEISIPAQPSFAKKRGAGKTKFAPFCAARIRQASAFVGNAEPSRDKTPEFCPRLWDPYSACKIAEWEVRGRSSASGKWKAESSRPPDGLETLRGTRRFAWLARLRPVRNKPWAATGDRGHEERHAPVPIGTCRPPCAGAACLALPGRLPGRCTPDPLWCTHADRKSIGRGASLFCFDLRGCWSIVERWIAELSSSAERVLPRQPPRQSRQPESNPGGVRFCSRPRPEAPLSTSTRVPKEKISGRQFVRIATIRHKPNRGWQRGKGISKENNSRPEAATSARGLHHEKAARKPLSQGRIIL